MSPAATAPRLFAEYSDPPVPPQPSSPDQAEAALAAWLNPVKIAALKAVGTRP